MWAGAQGRGEGRCNVGQLVVARDRSGTRRCTGESTLLREAGADGGGKEGVVWAGAGESESWEVWSRGGEDAGACACPHPMHGRQGHWWASWEAVIEPGMEDE